MKWDIDGQHVQAYATLLLCCIATVGNGEGIPVRARLFKLFFIVLKIQSSYWHPIQVICQSVKRKALVAPWSVTRSLPFEVHVLKLPPLSSVAVRLGCADLLQWGLWGFGFRAADKYLAALWAATAVRALEEELLLLLLLKLPPLLLLAPYAPSPEDRWISILGECSWRVTGFVNRDGWVLF